MVKIFSLLKRKEGMSLEAFRHWAFYEHPELGKRIPGIMHYRMNVVCEDQPDLPFDAVSEFCFADMAAYQAALASPEGQAAGADAAAHCANRIRLVTEERILIP